MALVNVAKISVEKHDSKEQFLYDLDKNKSLCEVIRDICKKSGLPESPVYGLKLIQTKDIPVNKYISEDSLKDVKHMDCLKIVFSIDYLLAKRILPYISAEDDSMEKDICFEDLRKLATDHIFIEKLEKQLSNDETKALLITIYNLFKHKGLVIDISQDILSKTIGIVQNSSENDMENVKYALSILHKILTQKDRVFIPWKEQIIEDISLNTLTQFIWNERGKSVQYEVISLVNAMIRLCKGEKKLQMIKEMNYKQNRGSIYKYIIENSNFDQKMEHELYVLQTYLLSLYREALETDINLNDNNLFDREDFELSADDVNRLTILMDFDEADRYLYAACSTESVLSSSPIERVSIASIVSGKSISTSHRSSGKSNMDQEFHCGSINYLTLEALRHYKKNFSKAFYQSQVEEKVYEPGIFVTSERIMKMLAKLLHIGVDFPDPKSTMYQPIVFNCSSRAPFLLELFSRSMWLLSRTRREMKVSTITDYPKVMQVLEKQLQMVLSRKPKDFKRLTAYMTETTFEEVLAEWQVEKDKEFADLQNNNATIIELKESLSKENEQYVICQRINILKEGQIFPKVTEKKTHLLGTLRSNRRGNPKEVINEKLKRGEVVAKENNRGICILKWKDKREVLMLSTKHTHETVIVHKRTGDVEKPVAAIEYNKAKSSIDLSDQMASYDSALRKTVKWYRKITILIFATAMVNAHFLYQAINDQSISITDFKESVVECLLFPDNDESNLPSTSKLDTTQDRHVLKKKEACSHKVRRYCKGYSNKKCKSPYLAFSLIINSEKYINFIANDEKMACYWTDAFHILTNTPRRSTYYKEELDTIVEMDVRLKLLELQNVLIPKVPPPVPPPPSEKPSVAPRTQILFNKR
nr:unnamed protein product [Callosobruchus chinensis]